MEIESVIRQLDFFMKYKLYYTYKIILIILYNLFRANILAKD